MAFHAQGEGFYPLNKHKSVEGTQGWTVIAQAFHAGAEAEGDVAHGTAGAKDFPELHAVATLRGFGEHGKFAVAPIKIAAIDNNPAYAGAVSPNPLGGRFYYNVGTVLQGLKEVSASAKGVVYYQWNAVAGSHLAQGLKIRNVETGIANGFDVQCLGFFINKRLKIGRIVAGHKFHLNAQSLKLHLKLVVGAAIEVGGAHKVVARFEDVAQRNKLRRLSRCHRYSSYFALERRHTFFKHIGGRVHDAGINVAKLFQLKQARGVLCILKEVGRGLVNGYGTREGSRVNFLSRMQLKRIKVQFFHGKN